MERKLRKPEEININGVNLSEILREHKLWVTSHKKEGEQATLYSAELSEADLSGAELSEAKLSEANLSESDLSGADLSGANLSKAKLFHTDFTKADLTGAMLSQTDFFGAKLIETNLSEASLYMANLSDANLSKAKLIGSSLFEANLSEANLSGATLSGATLFEASLLKANLSGAIISKANLFNANLSDANLSGAIISRSDLSEVNLSRTNLSGANLSETNLSKVTISETNFSEANLSKANLSEVDLSGANLSKANLSEVNLSGANLIEVDLSGANLSKADLSKADLSNVNLHRVNLSYTILISCLIRGCKLKNVILTGAVFNETVVTNNWEIKNIKCDYIFLDNKRKERYPKDRDFKKGEFEKLHRTIPTIEVVFKNGYDVLDHLAAPFLESYMASKGESQNLIFISINNEGVYPSVKYEIPPEGDKELILKKAEESIEELKKDKEYLQQVLIEAIKNPRIIVGGDIRNMALSESTIIDNSTNTINETKNFIKELENAPEFSGGKNQEEKKKTKETLKKCLGDIRKGALGQLGKTIMEDTIKKAVQIAPSLAPLGMELIKSVLMG